MQLDHVLDGDGALLYMERYVDEGTRTYSPFAAKSEVAPEFQPRSGLPSFDLVALMVPKTNVAVIEADPSKDLLNFYVQPNGVRFLVHPETWTSSEIEHLDGLRFLPRADPIEVAPTASTRTVLTVEAPANTPPHFIKLHYPRRISRFNRRLRRKNIQNSVEATRDLAHIDCERFAHLPDVLGFTFGDGDGGWGFLVREVTPRPYRAGRFLVPFFALYGGDLKRPDDPPLLVQLIERLGADAERLVVDEIIIPVLQCWAKAVRERGILLECHAQNILLEIDADFRPSRVVHRDCDVWIDGEHRQRAGLASPFLRASIGSDTGFPREQHYSLVYDHFLGRELFEYLLKLLVRFYGTNVDAIRGHVAAEFHRCFPDARDFFPPKTTYYFSNEVLPGSEFHLVDTKQAPGWR